MSLELREIVIEYISFGKRKLQISRYLLIFSFYSRAHGTQAPKEKIIE